MLPKIERHIPVTRAAIRLFWDKPKISSPRNEKKVSRWKDSEDKSRATNCKTNLWSKRTFQTQTFAQELTLNFRPKRIQKKYQQQETEMQTKRMKKKKVVLREICSFDAGVCVLGGSYMELLLMNVGLFQVLIDWNMLAMFFTFTLACLYITSVQIIQLYRYIVSCSFLLSCACNE